MKRSRLTRAKLLQELRKLLIRPDTKIVTRKLPDHIGNSVWEMEHTTEGKISVSNIRLSLDSRRDGLVTLVIHELLHVYMAIYLSIGETLSSELEESAILAWERSLYEWLNSPKREKQLESWAKAINRKLK